LKAVKTLFAVTTLALSATSLAAALVQDDHLRFLDRNETYLEPSVYIPSAGGTPRYQLSLSNFCTVQRPNSVAVRMFGTRNHSFGTLRVVTFRMKNGETIELHPVATGVKGTDSTFYDMDVWSETAEFPLADAQFKTIAFGEIDSVYIMGDKQAYRYPGSEVNGDLQLALRKFYLEAGE